MVALAIGALSGCSLFSSDDVPVDLAVPRTGQTKSSAASQPPADPAAAAAAAAKLAANGLAADSDHPAYAAPVRPEVSPTSPLPHRTALAAPAAPAPSTMLRQAPAETPAQPAAAQSEPATTPPTPQPAVAQSQPPAAPPTPQPAVAQSQPAATSPALQPAVAQSQPPAAPPPQPPAAVVASPVRAAAVPSAAVPPAPPAASVPAPAPSAPTAAPVVAAAAAPATVPQTIGQRQPVARADMAPAAPPAQPPGPPAPPQAGIPVTVAQPAAAQPPLHGPKLLNTEYQRRLAESAEPSEAASAAPMAGDAQVHLTPPSARHGSRPATAATGPSATFEVASVGVRSGSAAFTPEDRSQLAAVARLYRQTGGTVRIVGDGDGSDASMRHADAVARELTHLGVPADRLFVGSAPTPSGTDGARIYIDY